MYSEKLSHCWQQYQHTFYFLNSWPSQKYNSISYNTLWSTCDALRGAQNHLLTRTDLSRRVAMFCYWARLMAACLCHCHLRVSNHKKCSCLFIPMQWRICQRSFHKFKVRLWNLNLQPHISFPAKNPDRVEELWKHHFWAHHSAMFGMTV